MEDTSKIKKSDARVNNSNSAEGVAGRQDIVLPEYVDQNESNTVDNTVIAGDNKIAYDSAMNQSDVTKNEVLECTVDEQECAVDEGQGCSEVVQGCAGEKQRRAGKADELGQYVDYEEWAPGKGCDETGVARMGDMDDYGFALDGAGCVSSEDCDYGLSPCFDVETLQRLPCLLRPLPDNYAYDEHHYSMLVLTEIVVAGSLMPNVRMVKDGKEINPNLMLLISGTPATGKGSVGKVRLLVENLDGRLMSDYSNGGAVGQAESIILPGNSSNSKFVDMLNRNRGRGLIIESEATTLINMLENREFGLNRDTLLKAAEHEDIELARVTDDRRFKIHHPQLSMVATCVPQDLPSFLGCDGIQSGLLSRCVFFNLVSPRKKWRHWLPDDGDELSASEVLAGVISKLEAMYDDLSSREMPLTVSFSRSQARQLDDWIGPIYEEGGLSKILGEEMDSVLKRFPVHVIRIAMVLSVLREYESYASIARYKDRILVSDDDFRSAMEIGRVLLEHTKSVFVRLRQKGDSDREHEVRERLNTVAKKMGESQKKRLKIVLATYGERFDYGQFKEAASRVGYADRKTTNKTFHRMLDNREIVHVGEEFFALGGK